MKNLLLLSFMFLIGCQTNQSETVQAEKAVAADMAMAAPTEEAQAKGASPSMPTPNAESKIIKTADVRFRVSSLKSSYSEIQNVVKKANGHITNTNQSNQNGYLEYSLTIRVPATQFDDLMGQVAENSIYTDYKNIRAEDVTAEFIDTEARTKAKKAVEQRYVELLRQAKNVEEIMAVESKLAEIREEIEAKEGRLKYLKDQVAYSTINLSMYEQTTASENPEMPFYRRIWENFKGGFNAMVDLVANLFFLIPFVLVGGGAIYFIRKWWKGRRS